MHRLRHIPLFPSNFNPSPGLRIEGYLHDCWWPGEVIEQHFRKGYRICFDDGDMAWLVRRNVRPMLRRAPVATGHASTRPAAASGDASANGGGNGANAGGDAATTALLLNPTANEGAPGGRLPIRFPHDLNPHHVIATLKRLLASRDDWGDIKLSTLQEHVEALLLPDMPSGWLNGRRAALVAALEAAIASNAGKAQPRRTSTGCSRGRRCARRSARAAPRARSSSRAPSSEVSPYGRPTPRPRRRRPRGGGQGGEGGRGGRRRDGGGRSGGGGRAALLLDLGGTTSSADGGLGGGLGGGAPASAAAAAAAAALSLGTFLKSTGRQVTNLDDAHYILRQIGVVLFLLAHEQLALHNSPPPNNFPPSVLLLPPPPTPPAAADAAEPPPAASRRRRTARARPPTPTVASRRRRGGRRSRRRHPRRTMAPSYAR